MKTQLIQHKVNIKKSLIHGYGGFAACDIQRGEVIEESYAITTKKGDEAFGNFLFAHKDEDKSVLPLGSGSIFNHSADANANYTFDVEREVMIFKANKLIRKDEEIFIYYGNNWFDCRHFTTKKTSLLYKIGYFLSGFPLRALIVISGLIATAYFVTMLTTT